MEIVTGHHWVAQRIPDDSYAVCANRVSIQQVDFNNTDEFMWSEGIQEFVEKNHLNTDKTGWNFRHIFGTDNLKDRHYNTPRGLVKSTSTQKFNKIQKMVNYLSS